jgi:ankyrin repeat protein
MPVIQRLLSMGVDVNHQLTRKRPYGGGRGRFAEYDLRGGVGPLFVATIRHDHEALQALIKAGAEVDLRNVFEMTPLMVAVGMSGVGRGNGGGTPPPGDLQTLTIKTIDLLLDAGADVNARIVDSRTNTAQLRSYITGRDQEGRTALSAAAEAGRERVVKRLLERGANPGIADAAGKTALDYARTPPPAAPGGAAPNPAVLAARAATVALLEPADKKAGGG